uniref:Voltage-dependent calcium channel alpha-2/delta subunit conserved region domain-containing protein n=1 Tax=Gopherus evgoodei TaxID=1825980 RepID=A0A8C4YD45_9SAUR
NKNTIPTLEKDTGLHILNCIHSFFAFIPLLVIYVLPPQTGNFFGEIEGAVMNKLLTMGSFKRITLYDYQAMCRTNKESSDSAHSLLDTPGH